VPSIISLSAGWEICQIIWVRISNEAGTQLVLIFIIVCLIFIFIDFSFNIEELVATFASALSTMSLNSRQ
jgi:formate/nitrite transporter FocA (FNT family)